MTTEILTKDLTKVDFGGTIIHSGINLNISTLDNTINIKQRNPKDWIYLRIIYQIGT